MGTKEARHARVVAIDGKPAGSDWECKVTVSDIPVVSPGITISRNKEAKPWIDSDGERVWRPAPQWHFELDVDAVLDEDGAAREKDFAAGSELNWRYVTFWMQGRKGKMHLVTVAYVRP